MLNQNRKIEGVYTYFTLKLKTVDIDPYPDYAIYVKQNLALIGINVDIVLEDWSTFLNTLFVTRDFDIIILSFNGDDNDYFNLPLSVFTENGSLNIFGYSTEMDYDSHLGTGLNEYIIKYSNLISFSDSNRIQLAWLWQDYLQDWLLPMKPLFAPIKTFTYWSNLIGYNISDGLINSWGHMTWNGRHIGQLSTSEIVIADVPWIELNPFFSIDSSSKYIIDMCLDTLITIDSNNIIWPHLAENWYWINESVLEFKIREGIRWLDYGTFTNEYLTADDVYFSFYCWKKLSRFKNEWYFLSDFEKINDTTIRCYIDGDPSTPSLEPFTNTLNSLNCWIVPEHFLNQTQKADGVTPDITHPSWTDYSSNVWGTNLFEIVEYTEYWRTILRLQPLSWRLNTSITSDPLLDYNNRYGNYLGGLNTLVIRRISDPTTIHLEFEDGKIDLIDVSNFHDIHDKYLADPTKNLQSDISNHFNAICFNIRPSRAYIGDMKPTIHDPTMTRGVAVRKAIAYAIDRNEINELLHDNENRIWDYPNYPTLGIWNYPNIIRYSHDLNKAKEYMTRAGYYIFVDNLCYDFPTSLVALIVLIPIISLLVISLTIYLIVKIKRRKRVN